MMDLPPSRHWRYILSISAVFNHNNILFFLQIYMFICCLYWILSIHTMLAMPTRVYVFGEVVTLGTHWFICYGSWDTFVFQLTIILIFVLVAIWSFFKWKTSKIYKNSEFWDTHNPHLNYHQASINIWIWICYNPQVIPHNT